MQSGISVSEELRTAFQELVSDSTQFGLICSIEQEKLQATSILAPASASFSTSLSLLTPHLAPKTALYILLRRYSPETTAPYIAITYIPDAAPVRQKMLFASTRLTLVRELGIERFRETIYATTPEELTPGGFDEHDRHVQLEAPLTEEEQSLGEVKRKEAEEGRGASERKSHVSSGMKMPISEEAVHALKSLSNGQNNLVQLRIDIQAETIELASSSEAPIGDLSTVIASKEPRLSFYRYDHQYDGQAKSPILFIYTCPSESKVKERMLYAASSRSVADMGQAEAGFIVEKRLELSSPGELTPTSIDEELHPKIEIKKAFDRPKRPGRR